MNSKTFIKGFIAVLIISLIGDNLWHNMLLGDFYYSRLEAINGAPTVVGFPPFLIAFELIASAISTYFVLSAAKSWTIGEGVFHGVLMSVGMVGALNFVNHSLIPKWDLQILTVDVAWGIILRALSGAAIIMVSGKKAKH